MHCLCLADLQGCISVLYPQLNWSRLIIDVFHIVIEKVVTKDTMVNSFFALIMWTLMRDGLYCSLANRIEDRLLVVDIPQSVLQSFPTTWRCELLGVDQPPCPIRICLYKSQKTDFLKHARDLKNTLLKNTLCTMRIIPVIMQ